MLCEMDPETLSRNLRSRTKLFNALEKSAVHTLKKEALRIKGRGYCDVERASKVSRIDAPILFFFFHAFLDGFVANTCLTFDTESLREHIAKNNRYCFDFIRSGSNVVTIFTRTKPLLLRLSCTTLDNVTREPFFIFPPSSATIEQRDRFSGNCSANLFAPLPTISP